MEKQPELLLLSLKEMILRKIVATFWTKTDVINLMDKFPNFRGFCASVSWKKTWKRVVEHKVEVKISKLEIPVELKNQMRLIVRPIGLHILDWLNSIEQCLYEGKGTVDIRILRHLCWTPAGAIHYKRTAETLLNLNTLDAVCKFKIASWHCLVDFIPVFWEKLPKMYKMELLGILSIGTHLYDSCRPMQIYWAYVLQWEEYKLPEGHAILYLKALYSSVESHNLVATEYFFQKLSEEEQQGFFFIGFKDLVHTFFRDSECYVFPQDRCNDAFCYLLSQVSPEQQMQVLNYDAGLFFETFLTWRWYDLFLEKADLIWKFIRNEEACHIFLTRMKMKAIIFPELVREFFRRSPGDFIKHFVTEECQGLDSTLFSELLYVEDTGILSAIFKKMEGEDKVRLVSSVSAFEKFTFYLESRFHHNVEFCVLAAFPLQKDRLKLRDKFMTYLSEYGYRRKYCKRWRRFFKSLLKTGRTIPKRKYLDKTQTGAKKLKKRKYRKKNRVRTTP